MEAGGGREGGKQYEGQQKLQVMKLKRGYYVFILTVYSRKYLKTIREHTLSTNVKQAEPMIINVCVCVCV